MMLQASDYPILTLAATKYNYLERGFVILNTAIGADQLNKSAFKDLKDYINRAFEAAYKLTIKEPFLYNREYTLQPDEKKLDDVLGYGGPACHTVAGQLKKIARADLSTPYGLALHALYSEIVPLADLVNQFKTKIVVRVVKTEEERRPVYVAPPASRAASAAVSDVLIKITRDNFDALKKMIVDSLDQRINGFVAAKNAALREGKTLSSTEHFTVSVKDRYGREMTKTDFSAVMLVRDTVSNASYPDKPSSRLSTANSKIDQIAQRQAEDTRASFLIKNMNKLDSILEAKGDFDRVELLPRTLRSDFLEGTLRVFFKDGSQFTARNSIVWSYSSLGNEFSRLPLTFHEVMIAGKEMPSPSEKRMNTVFVK